MGFIDRGLDKYWDLTKPKQIYEGNLRQLQKNIVCLIWTVKYCQTQNLSKFPYNDNVTQFFFIV